MLSSSHPLLFHRSLSPPSRPHWLGGRHFSATAMVFDDPSGMAAGVCFAPRPGHTTTPLRPPMSPKLIVVPRGQPDRRVGDVPVPLVHLALVEPGVAGVVDLAPPVRVRVQGRRPAARTVIGLDRLPCDDVLPGVPGAVRRPGRHRPDRRVVPPELVDVVLLDERGDLVGPGPPAAGGRPSADGPALVGGGVSSYFSDGPIRFPEASIA